MRVFFTSDHEALLQGFRPCGHCMPLAFRQWCEKQSAPSAKPNRFVYSSIDYPRTEARGTMCEDM